MKLKPLRWLSLVLATVALVFLSSQSVNAATARHYTELEFPPLKELEFPDYDRFTLDNGMVVYLVEDHELPLIQGTALVKTGSRLEPAEKVGLAGITGSVMRSGGTETHSPNELNQLLEQRAASVETGISDTVGSASFNTLTEDVETVFRLFAEVIQQPAFNPEKLALAKKQTASGIARRNDDPNDIASREFYKLVYGEDSPYARTVEYATLEKITREDVVQFYGQSFRPDQMILGISGDLDPVRMKALIQEVFGDWQPEEVAPLPEKPEVSAQNRQTGVFFVEQPQLTQSYINLGHLGGEFENPDYAALSVVNGVLNGFGGRLFNEVRSRQGLAYSVYGYWSARYDYPGVFIAGGQTRSDATVPFVESVTQEIQQLQTQPITAEKLNYAKESILNSFVFNFQTPSQMISRLMRYEYYDYPSDYIFQYQQGIKDTTIDDVQRVAQEYLNPEQLTILVVGNGENIQPPLSRLDSDVNMVDIAIPSSPSS
ncbi:pitrilysin family protein [Spirulina sp. CS-785/01]|uniref:M16 family metallopeptidase n=1 Tax=Spirulina sp. CS-785/01 TaxID=3021716 RepID=UPI00232EAB26|nr:pitrilysin family protein [Spirulina sp. CS-785/01]MDB9311813.1 pitrilysin family protein [Spirulina sp. CS-785/01]